MDNQYGYPYDILAVPSEYFNGSDASYHSYIRQRNETLQQIVCWMSQFKEFRVASLADKARALAQDEIYRVERLGQCGIVVP